MPKSRPPYPPEFRQRIIELVRKGRTPESLAEQFEPTAQTIRNWLAQAHRDAGQRSDGLTTDEREELRRLRRENKTLREEREILKKAAVGSTGRRNAGGEYSAGGQEAEGFARSRVELEGDGIEIRLGVRREVGAGREVLPQELIGILIRPALPRTLGIAKVDRHLGPWSPLYVAMRMNYLAQHHRRAGSWHLGQDPIPTE
jgi:transposase